MTLQDIKPGTVIVSNSQTGPTFSQVVDFCQTQCGDHLDVAFLGDRSGQFDTVHHVGPADMLGIGWKLATESEIKRIR